MGMKFKITINGKEFTATMEDNLVVEQIANLCPFKTGFKRYKGHEYFSKLDTPIDVTGAKLIMETLENEIVFYSGENAITIFFENVVIDPYEIIYLGRFDCDVCEFLNEQNEIASIEFEVI